MKNHEEYQQVITYLEKNFTAAENKLMVNNANEVMKICNLNVLYK